MIKNESKFDFRTVSFKYVISGNYKNISVKRYNLGQ